MTAPLGVALIGAGGIGEIRAEAVAQTPGLELVAVADIDRSRAEKVAGRYGGQPSADPLAVAGQKNVDLVIISTPPNHHADLSLAALASGKHVLCEKPLAHTLADAGRMCAAAEAHGVLLKTGFNHRYFPAMAFARRLIDDGRIGEIITVQAYAGHPGGVEFGHDWVHDSAVTGGGSLVDNGIHILDLTRFFLDDPVVSATGYIANLVWPFGNAEDNGYALFRTAGGKVAQVHASWTQWRGYRFWVEIFGTRGYVKASYPPMMAEWGQMPEPGIRTKRRWNLFPAFQIRERLKGWRWTVVQSFVEEMSLFAEGIRAGREVPATGRDGLRAMQLAHAIYRFSREGVEVKDVEDSPDDIKR
ncbi:MAG: Gfo/Idh/MocA family oxidoreductase [Chloroflexi bacterium]|nr:Gfo/Idh/MocA family oxidoreductase [Chloroflexota bacterium]MCI0578386.1 Gfo/Idh/MocA family oxidoreductase [Chloroflexota bacterium]MCI0647617.1 Gfo/Idh/MocA family oxidoreductase [Chloroflexota bacterium]MCI0730414.1 Gfo/Idh/MocA family oxidoreductase [Chloroflexota bacterium]